MNKPTATLERLPDAILFDTDNTLYAYDPAHAAGMAAVRTKVCSTLSIEQAVFDRAFAEARQAVKARLDGTASSHSRLLYFQTMLEHIGLGSQVLLALDFEQTYWTEFLNHATLFDDVRELLDDLRILGIPTAIVTDLTAQIQFRKVVYFGLDHYIDYIVTSEEAGRDKPDPAPFRLSLDKMRPKGDNIWMVGDHARNDIEGARTAIGAVAIQKVHSGVARAHEAAKADLIIKEFAELRRLLQKLASGKRE